MFLSIIATKLGGRWEGVRMIRSHSIHSVKKKKKLRCGEAALSTDGEIPSAVLLVRETRCWVPKDLPGVPSLQAVGFPTDHT